MPLGERSGSLPHVYSDVNLDDEFCSSSTSHAADLVAYVYQLIAHLSCLHNGLQSLESRNQGSSVRMYVYLLGQDLRHHLAHFYSVSFALAAFLCYMVPLPKDSDVTILVRKTQQLH